MKSVRVEMFGTVVGRVDVTVEIEGEETPALVAEILSMMIVA